MKHEYLRRNTDNDRRLGMTFVLPVLLLTTLTAVAGWAWWCMARRPQQWARWVNRENDFWQQRGWISKSLAEKMKRWEKGTPLELIAIGTTCLGAIGVILTTVVLVRVISVEHQRLRFPLNPALQVKPAAATKPKSPVPLSGSNSPAKK